VNVRLADLAKQINADVVGDADCKITSVAALTKAAPGDITFLTDKKYRKYLSTTKASAVIIHPTDLPLCNKPAIVTENVAVAFALIAAYLHPISKAVPGVHSTAVIGLNCSIADTATIHANCVIGDNVTLGNEVEVAAGCVIEFGCKIGDNTVIHANAVINHDVIIGREVIIHPGAIIGSDGFGMANQDGKWIKVPQLGTVVIGDRVDIGANTTIDRGAIEDTVIGIGVKLDNQIQVAHNTQIGEHTAIAGCTGIAGSTIIGKHCAIGGMVAITGHLQIADYVQVTANSMIVNSIKESGLYSSGMPIQKNRDWHRVSARLKNLDDLAKRVKQLEKQLELIRKS